MRKFWRRFLARFRLSLAAICEESVGNRDYHDYPDDHRGWQPMHFVRMRCMRCGKEFTI